MIRSGTDRCATASLQPFFLFCPAMAPSTHRARSYSSSDDELLPIEVLRPWLYKGVRSPEKSRYIDPAEEAIPRTVKKGKSASTTSLRESSASPSLATASKTEKKKHPELPQKTTDSLEIPITSKANKKSAHRTTSSSSSSSIASSRQTSLVPDSEPELELLDERLASLLLAEATPQSAKLYSHIFGQEWSGTPAPATPLDKPGPKLQ